MLELSAENPSLPAKLLSCKFDELNANGGNEASLVRRDDANPEVAEDEKSRDDDKLPASRCVCLLLPPPSAQLLPKPSPTKLAPLLAIVAAALRCVEDSGDVSDSAAEDATEPDAAEEE